MNTSQKLDKIIEQNIYMISLLERIVDNAELVSQLQAKLRKSNKTIRELEYQQWFKEQQNNKTTKQ